MALLQNEEYVCLACGEASLPSRRTILRGGSSLMNAFGLLPILT